MLSIDRCFAQFFFVGILAVARAQVPNVTCHIGGTQPATDCAPFVVDFCQFVTHTGVIK